MMNISLVGNKVVYSDITGEETFVIQFDLRGPEDVQIRAACHSRIQALYQRSIPKGV